MAKDRPLVVEALPGAWADITEGSVFYEEQSPGLGRRFIVEMIAEIQNLALYAGTHSQRLEHYFAKADVWPWAIYYLLEGEKVVVTAVMDCRRNPRYIRHRLNED